LVGRRFAVLLAFCWNLFTLAMQHVDAVADANGRSDDDESLLTPTATITATETMRPAAVEPRSPAYQRASPALDSGFDSEYICQRRGAFKERLMDQPIRILLAKVGLDGHDRGVKVVARTLRDAGMDVVYTGLHRTPEEVVAAAVQEDVDILGVSLLSGVQLTVFPKILKLLRDQGADDMIVVAGGVMPDDDVRELKTMGVHEVLLQDTPPQAIVDALERLVRERGAH
jgi:2-hydroxyisobutanoyl-CoA mutase small subunit